MPKAGQATHTYASLGARRVLARKGARLRAGGARLSFVAGKPATVPARPITAALLVTEQRTARVKVSQQTYNAGISQFFDFLDDFLVLYKHEVRLARNT